MKKIFINFFFIAAITAPCISMGAVLQMDYASKKQEIWRATLIALSSYPLDSTNYEQGIIKTKVLNEGEVWTPQFRSPNSEYIYTISLNVFDSGYGTRVSINKELKRKANFNRNEEIIKTKSVEEDLILYRIKRELAIDRLIKKHFK